MASAYHHGNLRQSLVDAALTLIASHGPETFTLRQAARAAGVSPAAPYRHFVDKTELLAAVASQGFERIAAAIEHELADAGDDVLTRLQAEGWAYMDFALANPALFRAMHTPEVLDASRFADLVEKSQRIHAISWRIIRDGQRQGVIQPGDPAAISLAWIASLYGLARFFVDGMLNTDGDLAMAEQLTLAVGAVLELGLLTRLKAAEAESVAPELAPAG